MTLIGFYISFVIFISTYVYIQRERMHNLTTPVQLLKNTTEYNITPQLPEVPLYEEVSEGLGNFCWLV